MKTTHKPMTEEFLKAMHQRALERAAICRRVIQENKVRRCVKEAGAPTILNPQAG